MKLIRENMDDPKAEERTLRRQILRLEAEIANLTKTVAETGSTSLARALAERVREVAQHRARLRGISKKRPALPEEKAILARLREEVNDWRKLLRADVSAERRALASLLAGPVHIQPVRTGRQGHFKFAGELRPGQLLQGA
ncbi:MAG: hypothetical protein HY660_18760, partial [Armatimonadetes bacterium]|nr:hypothetical protein [Armatimonadota bacterium]